MKRVLQRLALLALCAVAFAGNNLQTSTCLAQTGNLEYVPELGGYLDWDSGLVWGDHSLNVMYPQFYMGWDYAKDRYLPDYRALTGIAAWRMPTVAELQTAAAHEIDTTIDNPRPGIPCWSSESMKVKGVQRAAAVYLYNGAVELRSKTVGACFVPVYRAFTP